MKKRMMKRKRKRISALTAKFQKKKNLKRKKNIQLMSRKCS